MVPPPSSLPEARQALIDYARTIYSAEATGIARECTEQAAEYAKEREQFGRPIAMFQAVKHHCANMLVATELSTAAVWDAARAADAGGDQFSYTAAMAATLALPAADLCANLNIQVHGGIGFTWEHDAHIYLRRAIALVAIVDPESAAIAATDLNRRRRRARPTVELPPEAEAIRDELQAFVAEAKGLDGTTLRDRLIDTGYVMPHWPAALRARCRRHRAAGDRAGVQRGRDRATRLRHHGLGHPDAHPARHRRPGRPLGHARRSTRK